MTSGLRKRWRGSPVLGTDTVFREGIAVGEELRIASAEWVVGM